MSRKRKDNTARDSIADKRVKTDSDDDDCKEQRNIISHPNKENVDSTPVPKHTFEPMDLLLFEYLALDDAFKIVWARTNRWYCPPELERVCSQRVSQQIHEKFGLDDTFMEAWRETNRTGVTATLLSGSFVLQACLCEDWAGADLDFYAGYTRYDPIGHFAVPTTPLTTYLWQGLCAYRDGKAQMDAIASGETPPRYWPESQDHWIKRVEWARAELKDPNRENEHHGQVYFWDFNNYPRLWKTGLRTAREFWVPHAHPQSACDIVTVPTSSSLSVTKKEMKLRTCFQFMYVNVSCIPEKWREADYRDDYGEDSKTQPPDAAVARRIKRIYKHVDDIGALDPETTLVHLRDWINRCFDLPFLCNTFTPDRMTFASPESIALRTCIQFSEPRLSDTNLWEPYSDGDFAADQKCATEALLARRKKYSSRGWTITEPDARACTDALCSVKHTHYSKKRPDYNVSIWR